MYEAQIQIIKCPICGEKLEVGYAKQEEWVDWEAREAERKKLQVQAHKAFDAIWKSGIVKRDAAYLWLAKELGIDCDECHFSELSIPQLKKALIASELVKARMLKAFNETSREVNGMNGIVDSGNSLRNSLNGAWVHSIPLRP